MSWPKTRFMAAKLTPTPDWNAMPMPMMTTSAVVPWRKREKKGTGLILESSMTVVGETDGDFWSRAAESVGGG